MVADVVSDGNTGFWSSVMITLIVAATAWSVSRGFAWVVRYFRGRALRRVQARTVGRGSRPADIAMQSPWMSTLLPLPDGFRPSDFAARLVTEFGRPRRFVLGAAPDVPAVEGQIDAFEFATDDELLGHDDVLAMAREVCKGDDEQAATLEAAIETARRSRTKFFRDPGRPLAFNGMKYGVFGLSFHGTPSRPRPTLHVYETDYFTYRVMGDVLRALSEEHVVRQSLARLMATPLPEIGGLCRDVHQLRFFFPSFGINCLVQCRSGLQRRTVTLVRRAGARVNPGWHVSMNEGLSQTDYDPIGGVSLEWCLRRGLSEELGIDDRTFARGASATFDELFIIQEREGTPELGLLARFDLNAGFEQLEQRIAYARDATLEAEQHRGSTTTDTSVGSVDPGWPPEGSPWVSGTVRHIRRFLDHPVAPPRTRMVEAALTRYVARSSLTQFQRRRPTGTGRR